MSTVCCRYVRQVISLSSHELCMHLCEERTWVTDRAACSVGGHFASVPRQATLCDRTSISRTGGKSGERTRGRALVYHKSTDFIPHQIPLKLFLASGALSMSARAKDEHSHTIRSLKSASYTTMKHSEC